MNVDSEEGRINASTQETTTNASGSVLQQASNKNHAQSSEIIGTDSSFKVITSVANTMIGSSMIVFPILFIKDGTIGSLITLMVVCVVQYLTCRLLVIHNRPDEPNFNKQILRILGYRWYVFNSMVNVSLLFFVCIGYYLLIVDNLFMVINALFSLKQQFAAIIATAICLPMLFLKEIDRLLKFFKYTIYCVIAFGIFIAVTVIKEIAQGDVDYSKFKLFDSDFSSVAGTFALSFLIHPVAAPILKKNVNQDNNKRDLLFGYILTAFIYFFVGFVGSLSCSEHIDQILDKAKEDEYSTVFSCFSQTDTTEDKVFYVAGKIVQLGVLIQNVSVMPILHFLTRKELLDFFDNPIKKRNVFFIETILFMIASLGTALLDINVSIVLSLDGAIIGFFMAYGIPIYMHLKCYHLKPSGEEKQLLRKSLLASENEKRSIQAGLNPNQGQIHDPLVCNAHPERSKISHLAFYGFIMCIGMALACFKIYALFE